MSQICFYLDENVPSAVAAALRRRNIRVVTVVDANLRMADDEMHMDYAHRHQHVLVTQDVDFLSLVADGRAHSGIVCAPQGTTIGSLVAGLVLIFHACTPSEMIGRVEFI